MSAIRTSLTCECTDPSCPACSGRCDRRATTRLYRIDMLDYSGIRACDACAADMLASGVYADHPSDNA